MRKNESAALRARLDAFIGQSMATEPSIAPDPVNLPMIRHWVDALDDQNPAYLDEQAARAGRFGGLVAPPAMLQTWTMGRPKIQGIAERGGAPDTMHENPITVLDDAGFPATRATNSELEFMRYLAPGDQLKSSGVYESISAEKNTALGRGYFVTWITTYTDAQNRVVGRQAFRVLKFAPHFHPGAPQGTPPNAPTNVEAEPILRDPTLRDAASTALDWNAVRVGDALPSFDLPVTASVIVAGAIASRDFMPVHHDKDYANAQGAPDIFMNILTTNGYASRYVTDWAGPVAMIEKISIRLGVPALPGTTLRFTGSVERAARQGRVGVVEAAINGATQIGDHVTGTVAFSLPTSFQSRTKHRHPLTVVSGDVSGENSKTIPAIEPETSHPRSHDVYSVP